MSPSKEITEEGLVIPTNFVSSLAVVEFLVDKVAVMFSKHTDDAVVMGTLKFNTELFRGPTTFASGEINGGPVKINIINRTTELT